MMILLQAFWQILILRKSPETLPYSPLLLGGMLALHLLLGLGGGLIDLPVGTALIHAALGTLLVVGLSNLLLFLYGLRNRLVQTLTAMAGCEIFFGLASLPLTVWLRSADEASMTLPGMLSFLLLGWYVAVIAHIWRHALGKSNLFSFLIAIAYLFITAALALLIKAPEG